MKKLINTYILLFFAVIMVNAQTETEAPEKDKPVRPPFESGIIIDNQTSVIPTKNTLEMHIQHRFGIIKSNGSSDLWGIYAPSANTRMGFNFSITNNIMIGYGITRKNMYNDFQAKWTILQQTRKNTIPLTVSVYGNLAIDGQKKAAFGDDYSFSDRLSYFSQIIVGRKFSESFSAELNASFTHYNTMTAIVENVKGYDHDVVGIGGHLRFKFSPQSSVLLMYTHPLYIKQMSENNEILNTWNSNFGIGYEVSTSTHAFQIFISTANGIVPQDIYMFNTDDWTDTEVRFGFNITRLWSF